MKQISKDQISLLLTNEGSNSSHIVWLFDSFLYLETCEGVVFAYQQKGKYIIFALEPLRWSEENFEQAWSQIKLYFPHSKFLFAGIGESFFTALKKRGFEGIATGKEPWISLAGYSPKGHSAKGIRAGRNQATRAGLWCEEWKNPSVEQREQILRLKKDWEKSTFLQLNGFLMASDPFAQLNMRRYFIVRDKHQLHGCLIASFVPKKDSYFFEDSYYQTSVRGTAELLYTQAIDTLKQENKKAVSLGVISLSDIKPFDVQTKSRFIRNTLPAAFKISHLFYNSRGIELFRKRFNPDRWEKSYIALSANRTITFQDWFFAFYEILVVFKPTFYFSPQAWFKEIYKKICRTPILPTWIFLNTVSFFLVNKGGSIPNWALESFAFNPKKPLSQWLWRSIACDFLNTNLLHYLSMIFFGIIVLRAYEKDFSLQIRLKIFICLIMLDDFFNYFLLHKPFDYMHPHLYQKILFRAQGDVGGSLILATIYGMCLSKRHYHAELFSISCMLGIFLATLYSSHELHGFVMNISYLLFFILGNLIGKIYLESERRHSRKVARLETPKIIKN